MPFRKISTQDSKNRKLTNFFLENSEKSFFFFLDDTLLEES